jgi:LmbE family N-acetylglucosaminyl deacetylase
MKLWVAPHNDDETLFGAFTIQRHQPDVVIVFGSYIQYRRGHQRCTAVQRMQESYDALRCLGIPQEKVHFLDFNDAEAWRPEAIAAALEQWHPSEVWIPLVEDGGHHQHNLVGVAGLKAFPNSRIHRYLTYTTAGKSTSTASSMAVPVTGAMVLRKLQALACYRTQLEIDELGCWPHFLRDQQEYVL